VNKRFNPGCYSQFKLCPSLLANSQLRFKKTDIFKKFFCFIFYTKLKKKHPGVVCIPRLKKTRRGTNPRSHKTNTLVLYG
jgi:hypothetical protein